MAFYDYQKLIRLRKENSVFVDGKFELLLPEDERIFAYTRTDEHTKMLVCTNFTDEEVSCPLLDEWKDGEVWIGTMRMAEKEMYCVHMRR